MEFKQEPIANVVKAVNDAVRKASRGTVQQAVILDTTPAPIKKFAPSSEVDRQMDDMISAYRVHEVEMLGKGANGFESAPYTGPMGGEHSLGCTFQMFVSWACLGYAERADGIHLWRMPKYLECRAYKITPGLIARIEQERKSNNYLVDAEPIVSAFAHATEDRNGGFEWTISVPSGPTSGEGEERIDKVFRHLPDQGLILVIGTPEEHADAESRLKSSGLWADVAVETGR